MLISFKNGLAQLMPIKFVNHCKKSMKTKHRGLNLCAAVTMLLLCCASARCLGQGTLQITFNGPPIQPPGTAKIVTNYVESGVSFASVPQSFGFIRMGSGTGQQSPISGFPDDGTAYIQQIGSAPILFSFTDGSVFDLTSVDLAEYSTILSGPVTVQFVGYHPDGSTVTESFTTDGIIDGAGPQMDFQTFNFTGFTGVTSVEIPSSDWSLDNLVISVPEPTRSTLPLAGGLVLGVRKFYRLRYNGDAM
jgi:hypothetical protein